MRIALCGLFLITIFSTIGIQADNGKSRFERALSLLQSGQFKKAQGILANLAKDAPRDPVVWFNLANCSYSLKQYERAIREYEQVRMLKAQISPLATLYIAKSLRRLNRLSQTEIEIQKLAPTDLPANLFKEVQIEWVLLKLAKDSNYQSAISKFQDDQFDAAMDLFSRLSSRNPENDYLKLALAASLLKSGRTNHASELLGKTKFKESQAQSIAESFKAQVAQGLWDVKTPYNLFVDLGVGYVSNFYGDGFADSPLSVPNSRVSLGAGYDLYDSSLFFSDISYLVSWDELITWDKGRTFTNSLQMSGGFSPESWVFVLYPFFNFYQIQNDPFLSRYGLKFIAQKSFQLLDFGFAFSHSFNKPQNSSYGYMEGERQERRLYISSMWNQWKGSVFYLNNIERSGDLDILGVVVIPLAHKEEGFGLSLGWSSGGWEVEAQQTWSQRFYFNQVRPALKSRQDDVASFGLKITRDLTAACQIYFVGDVTANRSTVTDSDYFDKNYTQFSVLGGVRWAFLK